MKELISKIEQWAEDRNLIRGCTPLDQAMKLFSEFGELTDAVAKDDPKEIKDSIGDVFVVMTIMCRQIGKTIPLDYGKMCWSWCNKRLLLELSKCLYDFSDYASCDKKWLNEDAIDSGLRALEFLAEEYDLTLQECVEHAYNEIKDRKGIMYNGTFIKESDARYKELT